MTPTVIVGAGHAGLAVAGCLRQSGQEFVVLEAERNVGASWRGRYDRLHLHTPRRHSQLPGRPIESSLPQYLSRDEVVEYLEGYARELELDPQFGQAVRRIERRDDGSWSTTTGDREYVSSNVVVSTGYSHVPHMPSWPGMEAFRGTITHSRDYKNGEPYRGKRVLVVGSGNTGAELAICLHEHGAESIALCVRDSVDIVPRRFLGVAITDWAIVNSPLPLGLQDLITRSVSLAIFGRLEKLGLRPSGAAISNVVDRGRIPVIDVGTVGLIRSGRVRVLGGIERFIETGVVVPQGEVEVDAVILATGYRTILKSLVAESERVLDDNGYPNRKGVESELPGLFFVGFSNPPTGLIRSIGIDAMTAAEGIRTRKL